MRLNFISAFGSNEGARLQLEVGILKLPIYIRAFVKIGLEVMEFSLRKASPSPSRRVILLSGLGLASTALWGCGGGGSSGDAVAGGGGGGGGGGAGGGGGTLPTGSLVYRNNSSVGVYNFAAQKEFRFDPGAQSEIHPGVSASRSGVVAATRQGSNSDNFVIALFGLDGKFNTSYRVDRALSFQTGAIMFNADASRVAFSVNEPRSAADSTRIERTLIATLPSGNIIARIDGYGEPVWIGTAGELLVVNPQDKTLRLFDANYRDLGRFGNFTINTVFGDYDASADGRYVAYGNGGNEIFAYDRTTAKSWMCAQAPVSSLFSATFSPDGRSLAVFATTFVYYTPHVVPFANGVKVTVDSAVHELKNSLSQSGGRMGWAN